MKAHRKKPTKLWPCCIGHVEAAIDKLGGECFATRLWPVVCDQKFTVIYNSFDADLDGLSMVLGWQVYRLENRI